MEIAPKLNKFSLLHALQKYQLFFGELYDENDFIELAFDVIRDLKADNYILKTFRGQTVNKQLELPCDVLYIESVATKYNFSHRDQTLLITLNDKNLNQEAFFSGHAIGNYTAVLAQSEMAVFGNFINYNLLRDGERYLIEATIPIEAELEVNYFAIETDKDGLPYINSRQAEAIALYVKYIKTQKEVYMGTGNPNLLQYAKKEYYDAFVRAKTPEHVSQNEFNRITQALTRYGRASFGKNSKPFS